ncbi:MAG: S8 family serine peptidase [Candidatus Krumholzibacteria bacterium]|nr:S8 family serine peptidase [Candidatus Krumholzibacteria bacterium]
MSSNRSTSPSHQWAAIVVLMAIFVIVPFAATSGQPEPTEKLWNFMPSRETGAQAFRAAHPQWDGRGVVVAILDTGVDAFAPGLLETTTGQTKLIDVRDFSTEGNWETALAELDESGTPATPVFRTTEGLLLRGAEGLLVPPVAGEEVAHPVYIGVIAEGDFLNNSRVHDLNDDGDTSDGFGFVVYAAERAAVEKALGLGRGYEMLQELNETAGATVEKERQSRLVWLVAVDTDGDGDLANEVLLRDYHVNYDTFALVSDNGPDSRQLMAWEVNVVANEDHLGAPLAPTLEFHFDDGSHGSHCAGIATGFEVSGQAGMHGAAPGAWLMSLKIGDNRLSGGATRTSSMQKAYEYAAAFEEKYGIPVVINMSFGINSVQEGDDAMGQWLNDLLAKNPTLYVNTSAGNEGPGLSTVGLPATSYSVISSGAYLSTEMGADLYSADMARATLFNFSSRGAEANKPDIVSPGSALSTVPGFVDGMARFNGTSMAAPQTAGVVACLVSAAQQESLPIHWGMMKRAIIAGGTPVPGLTLNDQGGGLVNTEASWQVLKSLADSESAQQVLWYKIQTPCAFQGDGQSEAAYWRTPGGAPLAPQKVTFNVQPVFHPDLGPDDRDKFFRSFRFKSDADWLRVVSGDRYIRGDMSMSVTCTYDGDKLQDRGAYGARVIASLDGGDLSGLAAREFYLWNTVVIGDDFGPSVGYSRTYEGQDLAQSAVHRYHVNVPAGASAMRVRLEVSGDTGSKDGAGVLTEICDPEGGVHGGFAGYARKTGDQIKDMTVLAPELHTGTWEINVASSITNLDLSDYRLTVSFDGYDVDAEGLGAFARSGTGVAATGEFTVTRSFPGSFEGSVSATMKGFSGEQEVQITNTDTWTHDFTLDQTTPRASFHLLMTKDVGNLFTDCAINIVDSSGKAVRSNAFDGLAGDVSYSLPAGTESGSYSLQVVGAFAIAADMADWGFDLEEQYHLAKAVRGTVTRSGGGDLKLYAGVPVALKVSFADVWPAPPEGLSAFGEVLFQDSRTTDRRPGDDDGRLVLTVPLVMQ